MTTQMLLETQEIPTVVANQLDHHQSSLDQIVSAILKKQPKQVMTVGRGSSDHATGFAKYLFETQLGWVTSSSAPSIVTIYQSKLLVQEALVIAVSQSGQSEDICSVIRTARNQGALTLAIVNDIESPLAEAAECVLPIHAGSEVAVAATKSFIATITALIHLVGKLAKHRELIDCLSVLPEYLMQAQQLSWSAGADYLATKTNSLVLGRGFGFPIALEAALKLKETCQMHAEAFSSAEVLHGPFAIVDASLPLLIFGQADKTLSGIEQLVDKLHHLGSYTMLALAKNKLTRSLEQQASMILPLPDSLHPICDPVIALQQFYSMAEACAGHRGLDPDHPHNLNKVTITV